MPMSKALLSLLAVYFFLYLFYRRKSGGRIEGFPGWPWLFVGSTFMAIASTPAATGGSREASIVGGVFFLLLFSFLAAQRFRLALRKEAVETAPPATEASLPVRTGGPPEENRRGTDAHRPSAG